MNIRFVLVLLLVMSVALAGCIDTKKEETQQETQPQPTEEYSNETPSQTEGVGLVEETTQENTTEEITQTTEGLEIDTSLFE